MRHFHDAKISAGPGPLSSGVPYFTLEGDEITKCSFVANGRYSSWDDQGVGGFGFRVAKGTRINPLGHWSDFRKSITSGAFSTCKAMTFHLAGFVKDGNVHVGVLFEAANRESLPAIPHEVYEVEGIIPIESGTELITISISPRGFLMDFGVSGDVFE